MFHPNSQTTSQASSGSDALASAILIGGNLIFNILANASFKLSAASLDWRQFLTWQVVGNLAGFVTVLTLTGLLRFLPLHIAYPVTAGLAVIGVQVIAAVWLFGESVSSAQWAGTLLVIMGIALIGGR